MSQKRTPLLVLWCGVLVFYKKSLPTFKKSYQLHRSLVLKSLIIYFHILFSILIRFVYNNDDSLGRRQLALIMPPSCLWQGCIKIQNNARLNYDKPPPPLPFFSLIIFLFNSSYFVKYFAYNYISVKYL